jgi:hypothetical protein
MLFLLRPRQTWMPYSLPRDATQQAAYKRELLRAYDATRRVDAGSSGLSEAPQGTATTDVAGSLRDLADLHELGALTDEEFALAKTRVLSGSSPR